MIVDDTMYDVIILGGHMSGRIAACALSTLDVSVCLVESAESSFVRSAENKQTCSLNNTSYQFLHDLGVALKGANPCYYDRLTIWDETGTEHVSLQACEVGYPQIGWIFDNDALLSVLRCFLDAMDHVTLLSTTIKNYQCDANKVTVETSDVMLTGQLLMIADRVHSAEKYLYKIPIWRRDCLHRAVFSYVQMSDPHYHRIRQAFLEDGALVFFPLSTTQKLSHYHCAVMWLVAAKKLEQIMTWDDETFCDALTQISRFFVEGTIVKTSLRHDRSLYQFSTMACRYERTVIVGGATHRLHPLAYPMNLEIGAIANFVEHMRATYKTGAWNVMHTVGPYERDHRIRTAKMLLAMEGVQYLYDKKSLLWSWGRNAIMRSINQKTYLRKHLLRRMVEG